MINNIHNIFNDTQEFVRIDHALGKKINVFYRYLHDSLPTAEGGGLFSGGSNARGVDDLDSFPWYATHGPHDDRCASFAADRYGLCIQLWRGDQHPHRVHRQCKLAGRKADASVPDTLGVLPSLSFRANGPGIRSGGIYNDHNVNHNGFGNLT